MAAVPQPPALAAAAAAAAAAPPTAADEGAAVAADKPDAVATLIDRVEANERDIQELKSEMEQLNLNVTNWEGRMSTTLNEILLTVRSNRQIIDSTQQAISDLQADLH